MGFIYAGGKRIDIPGVPTITFRDDPSVNGHPDGNFTAYRRVGIRRWFKRVRLLAIHHDATLSSRSCIKVLRRRNLSTHLLIDNDGTLFQMIDLAHGTWHAGKVNQDSIGLDMSNAADIRYASRYQDRGVFQGKINGGQIAALGYADPQYRTLIRLIRVLTRVFPRIKPIPPVDDTGQVIMRQIGNMDEFEGIVAHFHISAKKWDPGPGFDWKRVINGVRGGGFQFPLSLTQGGGGGDITGARFERTAERFYQINEGSDQGGWYPVGINGAWHSGVHLHVDRGRRVNNILKGEVVAARMTSYAELGSANFVLVRHTLKVSGEEKQFFALAMHLDEVSLGAATTRIPWLDRVKAKAGKRKGGDDDFDLDDIDLDDDMSADELRPKSGFGFNALLDGKVALFDPPVDLQPGELLGYVGEYGPLEDATPQVDYSILATEQIIPLDKFRDDFEELSPDEDTNSLCDIGEILRQLDKKHRPGSRAPLSSEAVIRFYQNDPNRVQFRGYIARHISEWWAGTDWREVLARRNVWAWDTRNKLTALMKKIAPFQWYTEEVAEATGLPADGIVVTYHPIRFLKWLARTQAGTRVSVNKATAQGLTDEELKRARAEASGDREEGGWMQFDPDGDDDDFLADLLGDDDLGDDWKEQGPGEWPPQDDFGFFGDEQE